MILSRVEERTLICVILASRSPTMMELSRLLKRNGDEIGTAVLYDRVARLRKKGVLAFQRSGGRGRVVVPTALGRQCYGRLLKPPQEAFDVRD